MAYLLTVYVLGCFGLIAFNAICRAVMWVFTGEIEEDEE